MVALTVLVVCIMTFNIFWLAHILDDTRHRPTTKTTTTTTMERHQSTKLLDYEGILEHEIKPQCTKRKTLQDIKECFPFLRHIRHRPDCEEINDWGTVQRCLTGRFRTDTPLRHIHIVGERHSGTKFLTKELQKCFPRHTSDFTFRVHRDFLRSKHFFQPILAGHDLTSSIVLVVVRDPVDWIAAMREKPYHSPSHVLSINETGFAPLPWHEFVNRPWTLRGDGRNEWELVRNPTDETICQENFHRMEVVPCEYNETSGKLADPLIRGFAPIYEMQRDGTGRPFRSIMELRAEKILNFVLEIPTLMDLSGFMIVRYEDVLQDGTQFVLDQLQEILHLDDAHMRRCRVIPPQPERLGSRPVPSDFRRYVREHMDPDMERLLGYG